VRGLSALAPVGTRVQLEMIRRACPSCRLPVIVTEMGRRVLIECEKHGALALWRVVRDDEAELFTLAAADGHSAALGPALAGLRERRLKHALAMPGTLAQREALELKARGLTLDQIAERLGIHRESARRRLQRFLNGDRVRQRPECCPRGHRFTAENTSTKITRGRQQRLCLACQRERDAAWRRARRAAETPEERARRLATIHDCHRRRRD
jgi:hypothetical protein